MRRGAVSRATRLALLATALLLAPPRLLAWGPGGHRIVAQIASDHLSPTAQAAIAAVLADEPEPTLAGVANWADEVRDERTGPLHYVNFPAGDFPTGDCRYQPRRDCPDGRCVVAAIDRAVAVLKRRKASRAQRLIALKQLVHFTGDIHQPLHAGHGEDRGGNTFQLRWHDEGTNLHKLWDSELIDDIEPDWRRYVLRLGPRPDTVSDRLSAREWAMESCAIVASEGFYPVSRDPGRAYLAEWRGTVDARLNLAGLRLAALLGTLFPG